ncbi:MAG TPA: hypothetical protein VGP26_24890 [Actinophytocola sp.]|jgi:hypothetical protein|nr:hypothetical protein [Actinophytocola sp.]
MDPFGADIVARTHRQDLTDQAEQARLARASRDCVEEQRPAPRPKRPAVRARRVAWLG